MVEDMIDTWQRRLRLAWNEERPLPENFSKMSKHEQRAIIETRNYRFSNDVILILEFTKFMRRFGDGTVYIEENNDEVEKHHG